MFTYSAHDSLFWRCLLRCAIVLISLLFVGTASAATDYYVDQTAGNDNNTGSQSFPWKNAPGMTACTNTCLKTVLVPGDTVYFDRRDTWLVSGEYGLHVKGGVTYIGDEWPLDGDRATLRSSANIDTSIVDFREDDKTFTYPTVVKGFILDGNGKVSNGVGFNHPRFSGPLTGGTKRVENIEVHHISARQTRGEYTYGIIVSNWGEEPNRSARVDDVEILNCKVHDVPRDAINLYPSDAPDNRVGRITVRGCEAYNTGQDPAYREGHGIVVKGWVYESTIEYNYIHNVDGAAVFFSGPEDSGEQRSADDVTVRYNILTSQANDGIVRLYKTGEKNIKLYGNIIFDNTLAGGLNLGGTSGPLELVVYNNTFWNAFVDLGGHSVEVTNNIINARRTPFRNTGFATPDSSNIVTTTNPGLKNPANKPTGFVGTYRENMTPNTDGFSLLSGRAIDGGFPLAGDYNGSINTVTRPQGANWDIGAYEMMP
jgi:hypothetical protein